VPGGFESWQALFDEQDRLNAAAEHLLSGPGEGYAGLEAAPENHELRVYWKGAVPQEVLQRATEVSIPIRFNQAAYGLFELTGELDRLKVDPRIGSIMTNVDGSGLTAEVETEADRAAILRLARVPITVNISADPQPLYDRQNDISPYWGGARWTNVSAGWLCSTGFTLNWQGARRMLTAGHCGSNGESVRIGNVLQPLTTLSMDNNAPDTVMINPPPLRTFAGRIYAGPYCCVTTSIRVAGSTSDFVGNWICTGGASSGEHCRIKVVAVNASTLGITPLTYAEHVDGACAAALGDSGGPVYSYNEPLPFWKPGVRGRGTITAGYEDHTDCPGEVADGTYRVYYAPLQRPILDPHIGSLAFYGATLLIG